MPEYIPQELEPSPPIDIDAEFLLISTFFDIGRRYDQYGEIITALRTSRGQTDAYDENMSF